MSVATKLDEKRHLTYEDYIKWDTPGERWELIDGEAYAMASPNAEHQRISRRLARKLYGAFPEGGRCEVFVAPFDVRLKARRRNVKDDTVVQSDLLVVCDKAKIDKKSIVGAPDMVIEIWSPSNTSRERLVKLMKYRDAGVHEIWFVDPESKTVQVFCQGEDGTYDIDEYGEGDQIPVGILEGFVISCDDVFEGGDPT